MGIEAIKSPVRPARANAIAERFVRTVRTECLEPLLILSRRHLDAGVTEHLCHDNQARPHRSLDFAHPIPPSATQVTTSGTIIRRGVFGGIVHEYGVAA